jgi:tryptophan-rich sensory protein
MKIKKFFILIFSIGISFAAGAIGSFFTVESIKTWYVTLNKPSFNPPNWVFGPLWTLLYFLMGISLYLVWTTKEEPSYWKKSGIVLFFVQLGLNALWSYVFFGMKEIGLALAVIVGLLMVLVMTAMRFYLVNKLAGRLLIPYILWVSFATILNLAILNLN